MINNVRFALGADEELWWLNWDIAGLLGICLLVAGIPLALWIWRKRRTLESNISRLADAQFCDECGSKTSPLGYLQYVAYEGCLHAEKFYDISCIVCAECAQKMVSASRKLMLKTCWKDFGVLELLFTFLNTRTALKQHQASLRDPSITDAGDGKIGG